MTYIPIVYQLEELKSKVNFSSIKSHHLPAIDLADLASKEPQDAHTFLMSKLMNYVVEQGNYEALDFLSRKMQAYHSLHPPGIIHHPGNIEALIKHLNQSDKKDWYEELIRKRIDALLKQVGEKQTQSEIEALFVENFRELEPELIWDENLHREVWAVYQQIGTILSIAHPFALLNALPKDQDLALRLEQLSQLRQEAKFTHWLEHHDKVFYQGLGLILDKSIDEIIIQVQQDPGIDKILTVFEKGLNQFLNYSTSDFSFGDTEDREAVGEYYKQIMDILGITSSRGLLLDKLY